MKIKYFIKKSGTTLIELMLTAALIIIATTISFSSFKSYSNAQNAKTAASQIEYILKKARYYTRANGVITHVILPVGSNTYSLIANGTNLTKSNNFDSTSGVLPNNTTITSNSCKEIYFYVDGSIVDSDNLPITEPCTISVGYNNNSQETIDINPQTGNIAHE